MDTQRRTIAFLGGVFLVACAVFACTPRDSPVPTTDPAQIPTIVTETPTATPTMRAIPPEPTEPPSGQIIPDEPTKVPTVTAVTREPTEVPTVVVTEEPTRIPTQPPTEEPEEEISIPYHIYVGLTHTGRECGGYTNSGWFSKLSFDAAFHDIRFMAPSTGVLRLPSGGFNQGGMLPLLSISGQGDVDTYAFCPAYDGDREIACAISDGPKPFEPRLGVVLEESALPVEPLVPDASELDRGSALLLSFSVGSAKGGGAFMIWDCRDFYRGALGGALQGLDMYFYLPWRRIMQGKDFTVEYAVEDDWGHSVWTLRLIPTDSD